MIEFSRFFRIAHHPQVKYCRNFAERNFKLVIFGSLGLHEVTVDYYGQKITVKEFKKSSTNSHRAEFSFKRFYRHPFEENYSATILHFTTVSGKTVQLSSRYGFRVSIFVASLGLI
jgi:hypothetical protein